MEQMVNSVVPDSVIRKIQLLLNLANAGKDHKDKATEQEALSAMAKAQELLAKYNVDISVLGTSQSKSSVMDEKRVEKKAARTAQYDWQVKLMKAICDANFCVHWITEVYETERWNRHGLQKLAKPQRMKRHVILGSEVNRTVVEMMYNYLVDAIEGLLPYPNTEKLSRNAHIWRRGCVDRLCERIEEKAKKMGEVDPHTSTESQTTALAIRSVRESEEAKNYDARYGEGAWARSKAREARWAQEAQEREAYCQSDEYKAKCAQERLEAAEAEHLKLLAETPEQKASRKAREAKEQEKAQRANERYWDAQDRKDEREAAKRSGPVYHEGRRKGSDINLDSQLKDGTPQDRLS